MRRVLMFSKTEGWISSCDYCVANLRDQRKQEPKLPDLFLIQFDLEIPRVAATCDCQPVRTRFEEDREFAESSAMAPLPFPFWECKGFRVIQGRGRTAGHRTRLLLGLLAFAFAARSCGSASERTRRGRARWHRELRTLHKLSSVKTRAAMSEPLENATTIFTLSQFIAESCAFRGASPRG